jgi:capsular polysaccharide biosynthesis protein
MRQRATEILFKHKLMILLPVIIIVPLTIWIAAQPKTPRWQSTAVVWIDQYQPLWRDERLGHTPATNQAALFNDFVRTRGFAREVIQQTDLAPLLDDPLTEETVIDRYRRSVFAYPTSNVFITISVVMADPELTYQIATASVTSFQEALRRQFEKQSQEAAALDLEKVTQAEAELSKARRELAAYLAARPELSRPDSGIDASLRDPQLGRLRYQLTQAEAAYSAAQAKYDALMTQTAAGLKGQEFTFTIVDSPERPIEPIRERLLARIKLPAVGLVLSLMLSSGIAVLLVITNRAVLGAYDVENVLALPVLGEVPELRRRRFWQRAPRDAVRLRLASPGHIAPASSART